VIKMERVRQDDWTGEIPMKHLTEPEEAVTVAGRVCTIRDRRLANAVLVGLVGLALAGAVWLASAMLAGPWLADTLAVEATVAAITVLAFVGMAWSLSRALGCGRCHTPQCRCT
jgi:hypothetical protein|tara:strand:+ start:296 stop:637 length:342 start_codon:yes stop_codon:yes gene_type:complete